MGVAVGAVVAVGEGVGEGACVVVGRGVAVGAAVAIGKGGIVAVGSMVVGAHPLLSGKSEASRAAVRRKRFRQDR